MGLSLCTVCEEFSLQWVPAKHNVKVVVKVPGKLFLDGELSRDSLVTVEGLGEEGCLSLRPGDVVQFERYGFVRVDEVEEGLIKVIYAHR